ncbi:hypothetical protein VOLCADRAFT_93469 [Volvox carteri f. nagariensis]|uniref:Uncharacterized protein n=1 Tax=Volvox carteri f. nagariensis TaxID=3068 RepID=D8U274_VOLCA|nr:uncharacterized protein VOLCADRAFT_93469 [Volvox carteri f. nagariensis]EFJ46229.1 hypothetical protein VOLCADRAFT_93469 [Volvox carteri f. nagariensis]|eukprot:XP_002952676.1 hypothetical protein VOLCADRAFT_93469 [Volvox carteri f. nagariensis]
MDAPYADVDDDEEDYFRNLDALLSSHQALKSILGGTVSGQPQPHQYTPHQPSRAPAVRQPPHSNGDHDESGSEGIEGDDDSEYEPSSEPESESALEQMEAAEAAARGVLDAEADIDQLVGDADDAGGIAGGDNDGFEEGEGEGEEDECNNGDDGGGGSSDADRDLESYIVRPPGEVLPPGSRLERLYAALDTNREIQRQLSLMLERLDMHSNTSYLLERRVREQKVVTKPRTAEQRAIGGWPPQTSRFWRVAGALPAPTSEWTRLAAAQQLPLRPYDRVRWPLRFVDALNKGLTLEVQSILTKQLLDRIQQQQQQRAAAGGGGGGEDRAAGRGAAAAAAAADGAPAAGATAAAATAAGAGALPTDMQSLQEQLQRIAAELLSPPGMCPLAAGSVRPDGPEAIPVILKLDDEAWARVAASHRVGRSGTECAAYYRHNLRPGLQWPLEESRRLMELAEKYGRRHWNKVAAELGTGRTAGQCLAHCLRWSRYDRRPERSVWSGEDDVALEALVAKYGTDWVAVAEGFGGRFDRHQVRDRWYGVMTASGPRRVGKWSADEDAQLVKAVDELGQKWTAVARHVVGRTARQCRERYVNLLQPGLKFGPFSKEEQKVLAEACRELQAAYGRITWARVAERLPGRTDDQCSRAYEGLVKHDKAHIGHKRGGGSHQLLQDPGGGSSRARNARKRRRSGGVEEGGAEEATETGGEEDHRAGLPDQEGQGALGASGPGGAAATSPQVTEGEGGVEGDGGGSGGGEGAAGGRVVEGRDGEEQQMVGPRRRRGRSSAAGAAGAGAVAAAAGAAAAPQRRRSAAVARAPWRQQRRRRRGEEETEADEIGKGGPGSAVEEQDGQHE